MMEGTGYDRSSILAALSVMAITKGAAGEPAVMRALAREGWACMPKSKESGCSDQEELPALNSSGDFSDESRVGDRQQEQLQCSREDDQRFQVFCDKLVVAERSLDQIERAESFRNVRKIILTRAPAHTREFASLLCSSNTKLFRELCSFHVTRPTTHIIYMSQVRLEAFLRDAEFTLASITSLLKSVSYLINDNEHVPFPACLC